MGLRVVVLLLGEESCETELLMLFGHDFDQSHHLGLEKLVDESVEELGGTSDMLFVGVDEIGGSDVVIGFDCAFGFVSYKGDAGHGNILNFLHIIFGHPDFFSPQWIIRSNLFLIEYFSLSVHLLLYFLQGLVGGCFHFLGEGLLGFGVERVSG
jgi:hypothetical protein